MITTTVVTAAAQTTSLPPPLLTAAQRDKMYKVRWYSVVSVAWTNIQVELVQRNNSLIDQHQRRGNYCHRYSKSSSVSAAPTPANISGGYNYYNMLPKRNCIGMFICCYEM